MHEWAGTAVCRICCGFGHERAYTAITGVVLDFCMNGLTQLFVGSAGAFCRFSWQMFNMKSQASLQMLP